MRATAILAFFLAISGPACGFAKTEKPTKKPAVLEHSHYRCSVVWSRDQKEPQYILYDLNCQAKKAAILTNVVVYTRKFNKRSYKRTTLDRNEFVEARNLKPGEEYVQTGRLEAIVRSSYRLQLVAAGEWSWPEDILLDPVKEQRRRAVDVEVDPEKYNFGLITHVF